MKKSVYCCDILFDVMENTLGGKNVIQKGAEWFILNDSWIDHGDGGTELRIYFCPFCGVRLEEKTP